MSTGVLDVWNGSAGEHTGVTKRLDLRMGMALVPRMRALASTLEPGLMPCPEGSRPCLALLERRRGGWVDSGEFWRAL